MNDQKWAYKTKWRVGKAIFFTVIFHAVLAFSIVGGTSFKVSDWVPEFLKPSAETTEEVTQEKPKKEKKIPVP